MPNSAAFEWVCKKLEEATSLSDLEARGTVRIALREAGLEARSVTPAQLEVVLRQLMPGELTTRAVDGGQALCERLAGEIKDAALGDADSGESSPEDVFRRLARS